MLDFLCLKCLTTASVHRSTVLESSELPWRHSRKDWSYITIPTSVCASIGLKSKRPQHSSIAPAAGTGLAEATQLSGN